MKKILFILLVFIAYKSEAANATRSDSLDIERIEIHADISNFISKEIFAQSKLKIKAKLNGINQILLDLEGLIVDSIWWNGISTSFTHSNGTIFIPCVNTLNQNDSVAINVFYHGVPLQDVAWGGFYFNANYAFQMGVGFSAHPHSFGRIWHPCFDNFVERASYEFYISTNSDKMAVCNGLFIDSSSTINNKIIWHYKLDETIPSYLASVAISNYVWVDKILNGINGNTAAQIAANIADTNKVHGSFAHLQESFNMLENNFGAYSFPKVGYTLVPFNAGAMEHATNIHIGAVYINGTLNYETLIAHELSHHWWGNLVTCATAQDMWLNEGWASYAEQLHMEYTYGYDAYIKAVRDNHFMVLSKAHINDNGYRAISPMDSNYTYGTTVYSKGADMVHCLRSYMGDSLFFKTCTQFLDANKFKAISSYDVRNQFSTLSGKNLNAFFDDWIFQKGFPHFSIDSTTFLAKNGGYECEVFLRHRLHKAANYFSKVPLEIAFYNTQFQKEIYYIEMEGRCATFKVQLPYKPSMVVLDPRDKIQDAVSDEQIVLKTTGTKILTQAKARAIVQNIVNIGDSSLLRIEHHWIAPDRFKTNPNNNFILCDSRYWKVDGINLNNIQGLLQFPYNGTSNDNFIDSSWIKVSEDNIRLFYRKNATDDWTFANDSIAFYNVNDKVGNAFAKEIKAGEYCFGIKRIGFVDTLQSDIPPPPCQMTLKANLEERIDNSLFFYPNPNYGKLMFHGNIQSDAKLLILNTLGEILFEKNINAYDIQGGINLPNFPKGIYILQVKDKLIQHSQKILFE